MSRTTTALKRLGVPGLAAVTMVAGLPLFLGTASAAHISGLTLSPDSSTDNTGVCVPYTVQLQYTNAQQPTAETVDVTLTEGGAGSTTTDADFCTAPTGTQQPATPQDATDSGAAGTSDRAEFTTDANGRVTFGVISNTPGTVEIRAFYETVDNDQFNAGEFNDTATQTFVGAGPAGSNENQNAANFVEVVSAGEPTPATATVTANVDSDSVVEGETRTYRVFVGSDADSRLAGVTVNYSIDSDIASADRGSAVFGVTDNNGIATGTITFPARTEATNSTTSTDNVTFFVNQTDPGSTPNRDLTEPQDTLTVTVRDAAFQQNRTVTLTPESRTFTGAERSATFTAVVDDPRTTGADGSTTGTLLTFGVSGGSGDETVTVSNRTAGGGENECSTVANGATTDANDSTCVVTVTDPTPTTGQVLTITATVRGSNGAADSSTLTFVNQPGDARFVALTPETVTVAPNTAQQLTARVTDVDGKPVRNVTVRFTESGPGAFRNGNSTAFVQTDENGVATIEVISLPGETGTMTVTADISFNATGDNTQCGQAAGQGTDPQGNSLSNNTANPGTEPAGVCADSSTVTFGTASPSPTASPTGGTTPPSPTGSPSGPPPVPCTVPASITLDRDTIIATGSAQITVRATPNSVVRVFAYSRPSTTYRVVRSIEVGGDGVASDRIVPPTNTRLYAQQEGCNASPSIVLNVRTLITLFVERNGPRLYTFSGRALPARSGGLIVSLYRVTNDGRQILTSQTRADASTGRYTIVRKFTGSGRFGFVVRTGQDLQNAPGSSNVRSLLVF